MCFNASRTNATVIAIIASAAMRTAAASEKRMFLDAGFLVLFCRVRFHHADTFFAFRRAHQSR